MANAAVKINSHLAAENWKNNIQFLQRKHLVLSFCAFELNMSSSYEKYLHILTITHQIHLFQLQKLTA